MASFDGRSGSNDRALISSDNSHATAVGMATADEAVETSGDDFASDDFFTPTYYIRRSVMEFDLTSVPANSTISSATLKIVFNGVTGDTNNMSVNVFHFTRGSTVATAFEAADFNEAVGTAACDTPKDITGLTGSQTYTLNAAAITYLQSKCGGYADFSGRISGDYTPTTSTGQNLINAYRGTDATESNRPRLEFTYEPPHSGGFYHMSV